MKILREDSNKLMVGLLIGTLFILLFNSYQVSQMRSSLPATGAVAVTGEATTTLNTLSGVIPTGVPKIYGEELEVNFDDVSSTDRYKADLTIRKLAQIDQSISLSGDDKERYINILYDLENGISCEYCCGAKSVIFENGEAACGCAHSFAMRGLTKYLITEHGNKYTDEEILEEVGKWKTLFFPAQMQQKASILEEDGIELSYINLASNKYRGIEKGKGSAGGMVGGC